MAPIARCLPRRRYQRPESETASNPCPRNKFSEQRAPDACSPALPIRPATSRSAWSGMAYYPLGPDPEPALKRPHPALRSFEGPSFFTVASLMHRDPRIMHQRTSDPTAPDLQPKRSTPPRSRAKANPGNKPKSACSYRPRLFRRHQTCHSTPTLTRQLSNCRPIMGHGTIAAKAERP